MKKKLSLKLSGNKLYLLNVDKKKHFEILLYLRKAHRKVIL